MGKVKIVEVGGRTIYIGGLTQGEARALIPDLVDARLAEDDTPAQAAAIAAEDAVNQVIEGKEMAEVKPVYTGDIAWAPVDDNDVAGWPIVMTDETLHPYTQWLFGKYFPQMEEIDAEISGSIFAVVDENDVLLDLEFRPDGQFSDRVIANIQARLDLSGLQAGAYRDYLDNTYPVASGPDIVCWGDSMTAGAGGSGTTYPGVLATLTGHTVRNRGVGGESSVTITARSGATPMLVIPSGGSIPASGSVDLTIRPINGTTPAPLIQGHHGYNTGTLAGVPGTISRNGTTGVYSFTRSTAGDAVTVDRPTPWLDNESPLRRGDIAIIWIGQNGPNHARAKADVAAIIRHLTALDKRYLVVSRPTSTDAEDAEWHDLYGRRFIAIRQYMVEYGLADAGITPTAQDTTDMANGTVPSSLRVNAVHWNAAGYTILAEQVYQRLQELEWV